MEITVYRNSKKVYENDMHMDNKQLKNFILLLSTPLLTKYVLELIAMYPFLLTYKPILERVGQGIATPEEIHYLYLMLGEKSIEVIGKLLSWLSL